MSSNRPPLKALQALEAVIRCGGISPAAAELGVTHGAVSKQIAALESALGRNLFERDGRRFRPYDEALMLGRVVGECLERIDLAVEHLAGGSHSLRVQAHASFTMHWLVPRLPLFYAAHPGIEVHVQTRQTDEELKPASYDVVIVRGEAQVRGWRGTTVMSERLTLLTSGPRARAIREGGRNRLLEETLVMSDSRPGEAERWLAEMGLSETGFAHIRRFGHFHTAIAAVLEGQGVIVGPTQILKDKIADGRLVAPFPHLIIDGPNHAAFTPTVPMNPRMTTAFVNWLKSVVEDRGLSGPSAS